MAAYDGSLLFNTKIDTSAFDKLTSVAGKAAAKVTAVFTGAVTAAGMVGSQFEEEMSAVGSIALESAENMELLTVKAQEMGATTKFSASESGKAFEYMAMAGWKTEQMLGGIDGIMNLAAASGEDLATVSDIVTDALTAFGMTAAESGKFADVLAAASSNANTNVAMLGESFKYAAPLFGALSWSAEDAAVALGLMANAGIKGSQSGTALRAAVASLAAPSKEAAEAMKKYSISLTDESGKMLEFSEVMEILRDNLGGLGEAEQTAAASTLFGTEAMSGMLAVINASEADYNKLTEAIANSAGMTEKMSEIRLDNLRGDVTILKSGLEALGIAAFDKFKEPLREAVQAVTKEVEKLTESIKNGALSESFEKVSTKLAELAGQFLEFAANKGIPALINAFEWVIDNGDKILSMLEVVAGGYATIKIMSWGAAAQASIGGTTIAEQAGLMAKSLASPVGIATALAAAIAGIGLAVISYKRDKMEAFNASIAYPLQEELDAVRELNSAYENTEETAKKAAQEKIAEADRTKALWVELNKYVDSSGKVISNKERVAELTEQINSLIPGTISLLDDEITNYKEAAAAIEEYVNAAKQKAVMEYKSEGYAEAKTEVTELEKKFAEVDKQYSEQKKRLIEATAAYEAEEARLLDEYTQIYLEKGYTRKTAEEEAANDIADLRSSEFSSLSALWQKQQQLSEEVGNTGILWSEQKALLDGYYDTIQEYEGLTATLADGDTQAFDAILNGLKGFYGDYSDVSKEEIEKNITDMQNLLELRETKAALGEIPAYMVEEARTGLNDVVDLAKDYIFQTGKSVEGVVFTASDYYSRLGKSTEARVQAEYAAWLAKNGGTSSELAEAGKELGEAASEDVAAGFASAVDDLQFELELGKITNDQYNVQLGNLLNEWDSSQTKAYREHWSDFTRWQQSKAEESVSGVSKVFEDAVSDLDFDKLTGKIDDDEYGRRLGELLKQYDSAQTKAYSNYWSKYFSWQDKKKDEDENAALKEIETWQKASDKLVSAYEKRYNDIIAKRDNMISKLSSDSLYEKLDPDAEEEDDTEYEYTLADNSKQKKQLDEYEKLLKKLQGANASEDFMNEFLSMDIEKALEFGKALSSAKGGTAAWLKSWQENRDREKQLANDYVKTEVDKLNEEFAPKFENLLLNVPNAFGEKGRQSLQGYIDGLNEKKEDADAAVVSVMDGVIKACEDKLEIHSPSKVMYEMGEYTADGFIEGLQSKSDAVYQAVMNVFGSAFDDVYAKMQAAVNFSMSAAASDITASAQAPKISSSSVSGAVKSSFSGVSGNEYNLYVNNEFFGRMVRREVSQGAVLTGNSGFAL